LAATVKVTVPDPVRPVPFVNVKKLLALVALHAQPVCVVTVMLPVVPPYGAVVVAGLIEYVQGAGAAACETLNVWPATVAVPVRAVCAVLAATVYVTVPDPVRPLPFVNVKKLLALVALHAQPVCVVTVMLPVVPPYGAVVVAGLIE
jgi:hypothetical protein